jgi:cytoskeletal protein CcmA (bactofilin family)
VAWYKRQQEGSDSPEPNPAEVYPPPATAPEPVVKPPARAESWIGGGLRIKGDLVGGEDFRVDGRVEGKISLGGRVTVGQRGVVAGPIEAREIVVQGTVRGNLRAAQRVEIGPTGVLDGDLAAERLHIAEGARVHGRIAAGVAPEPEKHSARPAHGGRGEKLAVLPIAEAEIPDQ